MDPYNTTKASNAYNRYNRYDDSANRENLEIENASLLNKKDKKDHCLSCTLCLWAFLFLLVVFILSCMALGRRYYVDREARDKAYQVMKAVETNLNLPPVKDVVTVAKGNSCPTGYNVNTIGTFHGTKSGCICQDGSVHTRPYCWIHTDTCKYTDSLSAKSLVEWDGISFCFKTYDDYVYVKETQSCPKGYNSCQVYLCVKDKTCPITAIKHNVPTKEDPRTLIYERKVSDDILVDLETSENGAPCIDFNYQEPKPKDGKYYPLKTLKPTGCAPYDSSREISSLVGSETEKTLLTQNGLGKLVGELPYYKFDDKHTVGLYNMKRVPMKREAVCKNFKTGEVKHLLENVDRFNNDTNGFGITLLILSLVGIIFMTLWLARKKIKFFTKPAFLIVAYILCIIIAIIAMAWTIRYWYVMSHYDVENVLKKYSEITANHCFKINTIHKAATDLERFSSKGYTVFGPGLIFLFSWSIVFLVVALIIFVLRKKLVRVNPCLPPL